MNAIYRLIWQRFVASQMTPSLIRHDRYGAGRSCSATGSYRSLTAPEALSGGTDEKTKRMKRLSARWRGRKGETLALNKITPEQHFTDPPLVLLKRHSSRPGREGNRTRQLRAIMTTIQARVCGKLEAVSTRLTWARL